MTLKTCKNALNKSKNTLKTPKNAFKKIPNKTTYLSQNN